MSVLSLLSYLKIKNAYPVHVGVDPPDSTSYIWLDVKDGTFKHYIDGKWVSIDVGSDVVISKDPPVDTQKLWLDLNTRQLKYFNGSTWTAIEDKFGLVVSKTVPSDLTKLWFNPDTGKLKYYNGQEWVSVDVDTIKGITIDNSLNSNSLWTSDKIVDQLSKKADIQHIHSISDIMDYVPIVHISDIEPTNTNVLWFDTTSNLLKYFDSDTNSWEPISGDTNVIISEMPPNDTSRLWFDTVNKTLNYYNGKDWVPIVGSNTSTDTNTGTDIESNTIDTEPLETFAFFTGLL